jgi:hypothetical protein
MSKTTTQRWIGLAGLVVLSGLLLAGLFVGTALAQGRSPRWPWADWGPRGMMGDEGYGDWGHGRGMMGSDGYGHGPAAGFSGRTPYGHDPGGCPMGGGGAWVDPGTGTPITLDEAVEAAEAYIAAYGNSDLELAEVMEFSQNFYAQAREKSTGVYAFELLINPYSGAVHPEPGPNMMWNTKYGHMGGLMGGWWRGTPPAEMTVTPEQARELAQEYLDAQFAGAVVDEEVDTFYGYYTLHTLQDEEISGMLSVNGYNGQVWYHNWHGDFIGLTGHGE